MDFKVIKLSLPPQNKPQLSKINFCQNQKQSHPKSTLRFLKNKNIVESNKQNIDLNHQFLTQKLQNDSHSRTSKINSINNFPRSIKTQRSTLRISQRFSILPLDKRQSIFSPQIKSEIVKRHQKFTKTYNNNQALTDPKSNNNPQEDKLRLQKLLHKNKISGARCLMGKNIPKIQQKYSFSRFELFHLYTYYKTLLEASKKSIKQLRRGFESIMYINKIELNSEMVERMFVEFFEEISFENFMKVYGNIQNLLFTQNIIEYMIKVFSEFYKEENLSGDKVLEALKEKLDEGQAIEIKKLLYQFYGRREWEDMIQVKQILNACSQSSVICKRIFNGMHKQSTNKESAKEKGDKK